MTNNQESNNSNINIRHVQNFIINETKHHEPEKRKERVFRVDKKGNVTNLNNTNNGNNENNENDELINFFKMMANVGHNETTKDDSNEKTKIFKVNKTKPIDELEIEKYEINTLINLGKLYEEDKYETKNYSIDIEGLYKMTPALKELESLIGMKKIKTQIVEQIIFFCQDIHDNIKLSITDNQKKETCEAREPDLINALLMPKKINVLPTKEYSLSSSCVDDDANGDMFHTIIQGSPGTGKTILGKILAKIYLSLGITTKDTFKIIRRSDMIGEYLGHTSMKTQSVIDEAMGGVLFIDEAYTLGSPASNDKGDSYAKECIDTLNHNLTVNKGRFVCIIAGYQKELEENFFAMNPGLKRRFSFNYTIDEYSPEDMIEMLIYMVNRIKWTLDKDARLWLSDNHFFDQNKDYFKFYGGDIETYLLHCKIVHGKRVFGKSLNIQKSLTIDDLEKGFQRFRHHKNIGSDTETEIPNGLYS